MESWRRAAAGFAVDGEWLDAERLSTGHIHGTWLARCRIDGEDRRFVLQSINTRVFPDPAALMDNVARVITHLRTSLERRGTADLDRRCLRLVPARDGRSWVEAGDAGVWRASPHIGGSCHHDTAPDPAVAEEAARVFGEFVALLADWSEPPLVETIPHFHDLASRSHALERAVAEDRCGRLSAARSEVEAARSGVAELLAALGAAGSATWPVRIVHNDCKLNNVLFDRASGVGLCAVDLDTVMPGQAIFDMGEIVRSATCSAPEDERDLDRVVFDLAFFRAVARGFLRGIGPVLDASEHAALPLAGPLMTLENGVRFLTDHLEGDGYFPAHRPGHNLDRARAQLRLFGSMWEQRREAAAAVDELRSELSPRSR